jgi:nucleotide-binding universal stress UspA family protein
MNAPKSGGLPQISRILVATDFSAHARKALEWAKFFADAFRAELVLLHVIDIFSLAETAPSVAGFDPLHLLREQAHKCMTELKAVVPDASPRPVIVESATDLQCQMGLCRSYARSVIQIDLSLCRGDWKINLV